jgi:hypothetical protein
MMAFQSPGVQVLGLTTIFGNCTTEHATRNALILCEKAGHPEVPVAEGSHEPLKVLSILPVLQFAGTFPTNSCEIRRFCVPSCGISSTVFISAPGSKASYGKINELYHVYYLNV